MIKTLAYADDVAVITNNDNNSISQIFEEYMKLTKSSGLTLNADKTEILNLSNSMETSTVSKYNDVDLHLSHKPAITICGNYLSLNDNECYQENVIKKIDNLTSQLNRWKGRNLSINGKMIIVKTFAISQLIFTSQFQTIRPKEVKRIEQLCYSFVWNGKDRVKRSTIKSGCDEGGINGIVVKSFFYSIAVRQFDKSNLHSKLNCFNLCPDIVEDIKTHARFILHKILMRQLAENDIQNAEDAGWLTLTRADLLVKSYSKIHKLLCYLGVSSISSITFDSYLRKNSGSIRRSLPSIAVLTVDRYLTEVNIPSKTTVIVDNKQIILNKIGSRKLNELIKLTLKKVAKYHPADKYKVSTQLFGDIRQTWNNLWRIKNPTLRAIWLKVLHKDIWTQEKRVKLGITNSSACEICGEHESVTHQLLTCINAKRLWSSVAMTLGIELLPNEDQCPSQFLVRLIKVTNNTALEIVKSVIFKLLIQIDRS